MSTLKLEQYINFESLEEMNHHVSLHVKNNNLNDTQYKLLTVLAQYSCKYLGASYLKLDTLAGLLDVSKRTVQRNLNVLVELEIIEKVHCFRKIRGGFGASIFIIKEYIEEDDHSDLSTRNNSQDTAGERLRERLKKTNTTFSKSKYNNSVVPNSSDAQREYNLSYKDVVPSFIPTRLGEYMIKFFDSATVTRLYNSMSNALRVYKGREEFGSEHIVDWMYRATNALILAIKNHRHNPQKYSAVKNMYSYVYQTALNIAVKDEFSYV
ncbi:helix-turn-helix domain-containing protein [Salinicoccus halitifaciens]|uniref:Helix-turn-helix domain-containing protein n=1 Tax=Salinicoccus halitifaciens TaxID=1073415 RepID=A0ABV2E5Q4_9STAP|nr:helix-turn-helix domain-containing protein [Salinicoccus halitifaciens]MCD2137195.1 helix-turn-helix domain-containing protein [Salinicoccus halitifaciens]